MHLAHHAYSILSVPFYDSRQQQYTKILCINAMPSGALADRVKTVRPPRLSGLSGGLSGGDQCIHALTRPCGAYMTPDELPELFAFLMSNGYSVDTGLTKLAAKHQYGNGNSNSNSNGNGNGNGNGNSNSNKSTNANSLVCIISCAGN